MVGTTIKLPGDVMLFQSLSYLSHDLAHDLHPKSNLDRSKLAWSRLSQEEKLGIFYGVKRGGVRTRGMSQAELDAEMEHFNREQQENEQLDIELEQKVYNNPTLEPELIQNIGKSLSEKRYLYATDFLRTTAKLSHEPFHYFFILWPQELNHETPNGSIFISNIDPKFTNIFPVNTVKLESGLGGPGPYIEIIIKNPWIEWNEAGGVTSNPMGFPMEYVVLRKYRGPTIGTNIISMIIKNWPAGQPHDTVITFNEITPSIFPSLISYLNEQRGILSNYLLQKETSVDQSAYLIGGNKKKGMKGGGEGDVIVNKSYPVNFAYVICMASASHFFAWNKIKAIRFSSNDFDLSKPWHSAIAREEFNLNTMMDTVEDKKGIASQIDQKLKDILIQLIPNTDYASNNANYFQMSNISCCNALQISKAGVETERTLFSDLVAAKSQAQNSSNGEEYLKLFYNLKNANKKYYLSNAVQYSPYLKNDIPASLYSIGFPMNIPSDCYVTPYFCNTTSIMDAMSSCSNANSASQKEGLMYGNIRYTITDFGETFSPGKGGTRLGSGLAISYNLYVNNNNYNKASICANYKIGDYILIDIAPTKDQIAADPNLTQDLAGWPNPQENIPRGAPIEVDLNAGSSSSPLQAVNCFVDLLTLIYNLFSANVMAEKTTFLNILKDLRTDESADFHNARTQILNISFRKSLGDVLQELTAVADNGGYLTIGQLPNVNPPTIALTNEGRLILSADRPSGGRLLMYILYGTKGINPNVLGGYINVPGVSYRHGQYHNSPGEFILAGRTGYFGGSKNFKYIKRRLTKKYKKSRKTKKYKKNRYTKKYKKNLDRKNKKKYKEKQ